MVRTSTAQFTDTLTFTIQRAFELCEIAEYDEAADSLPLPDLESSDGDLLFVWGVIASGQGQQEQAKDLLSKAVRLLDSELANVYLAVCYWRLGEDSTASILLDSQPTTVQATFCWLSVRMMIQAEQRNWPSESIPNAPAEITSKFREISFDNSVTRKLLSVTSAEISVTETMKPILYNNRLLVWQLARLRLTPGQVAATAKISEFSVNRGLNGTLVSLTKLRPLADALKVNWRFITNTDLPESQFPRAVINGKGR